MPSYGSTEPQDGWSKSRGPRFVAYPKMWETREGQLSGSPDDERRIDGQHLEVVPLEGARAGIDPRWAQSSALSRRYRRGLAIDDDSIPFAVKVRREDESRRSRPSVPGTEVGRRKAGDWVWPEA